MTAKVGPLPVWGWAVALLLVGYLVYRLTASSSSSSNTGATTDTTSNTDTSAGTPDTSGTPGPDNTGSGTSSTDTGSLSSDLLSQVSGWQNSVDALTEAILSSQAFLPGSGDSGSGSIVPNGSPPPIVNGGALATHTAPVKVTKAASTVKPAPTLVSEHGKGGGYTATPITRYYTYAPGKAPKGQKANEAPASVPGKTLHFAAGKGYYYL